MQNRRKSIHLNFKQIDWKIPLLICIACFYIAVLSDGILKGNKFAQYRGDYLAFWSVGNIINEKGFTEIYDLNILQNVQSQGVKSFGFLENIDGPSNPVMPVPYFSLFISPFQLLPKVPIVLGYWLWNVFNLFILIGYLVFYLRKVNPGIDTRISDLYFLSIVMIAYPVFFNFLSAQVEVFLMVCAGEFIRAAVGKKPFFSGLWLGGLLLKPPLLIMIIPLFLLLRYWKVLLGFIASSGIILGSSLLLSGLDGMKALINLWTKYGAEATPTAPEIMINWRMVGVNLDQFLNISFGWIIVGLGMILTIIAVFYLVRRMPPYGSPLWIMTILGVFSATLSVTWHSHYHMSMVMIPFLIYTLVHKSLPEKIILSWNCITPVVFLGYLLFETSLIALFKTNSGIFHMTILGLTGLVLNMVILYSILQSVKIRNLGNK